MIGSGSGADPSTCFSDISCDSHSDRMAVDDWADNFVQACFDSPACQQQDTTQSMSLEVIGSSPQDLVDSQSVLILVNRCRNNINIAYSAC